MDHGLYLAQSVELGVDGGVPVLRHLPSGTTHELQLGEAIALSWLGAVGNAGEAAALCAQEIDNGEVWVDRVVDRYWSYLGGDTAKPLDFSWMGALDFATLAAPSRRRREPAPQSLVWLVTLACNRSCPYCYYAVTHHELSRGIGPADATFSSDSVLRILEEMARIGTSRLYLTGGEPLLLPDLIDILAQAHRLRIRTYLSTRYPIDDGLARRMADAGLHDITYSLDAGEARVADDLAGTKGFFAEALRALRALSSHGMDPEVNAVLTRANVDRLDDLARVLVDCGVSRLSVSLLASPVSPRSSEGALRLLKSDSALASMVHELSQRWADRIQIRLGDSGQDALGPVDPGHPVCEVGFTNLHVLPDGEVTKCRYLPSEPVLRLGSLEEMTLMEIWEGQRLKALNGPPRTSYQGTACASCDAFEHCNDRGRCYASALRTGASLTGPDHFCLKDDAP